MASLARCIAKAGKNISRDDAAELMDRYEQARKDGYGEREAGVIAAGSMVDEAAAQVEAVVEAVREAGVDPGVTVGRGDAVAVEKMDTSGARRDRVQQVAERAWGKKLVRALVDRGVLTFASAEEVAAAVPELSAEQIRKEGIRGVYANGKAYVVTDVVPDSAVAGVVLHEVGVHYGLEKMVGQKALKALLYDLSRLRGTDTAVGKAYAKAEKEGAAADRLDEEALAYLSEANPAHSLVQRMVEAVKRFLKSLGVPVNVLSTEAAAIRDMAVDALRAAGRDGALTMTGGAFAPVMASKTAMPEFKVAGPVVDGLEVREKVPNRSSISSSLDDYTTLDGIREVPFSAFGDGASKPTYKSATEKARTLALAEQIKESGEIAPLIVVVDKEGPYILEGAHRFDALLEMGKTSFPALVVMDETATPAATGNTGAFSPTNPDIRYSKSTPTDARIESSQRKDTAKREAELKGQQIQGGALTPIPFDPNQKRWEGWRGTLRKLRVTAQDKFLSFLYAKEDIEKVRGALNEAADVHRRENLMHGRVGDQVEQLKRKHVDPLLSAMRLAGVKPADLEQYLYARHAAERNARIAKINPSMPDGGSGMTTEAALQVIAALETPAMKALAERVYKVTKQTRQTLVDSGLITREQFNALEAMYQDYVPLRGKDGVEVGYQPTGGGVDVRGQPIKLATGRGAGNLAKNILAETIADAQRAIIQAEKARVGRTALRLVLENPNDAVWEVEPVETENRVSEASGTVYEAVRNISSDPGTVIVPFEGKRYRIKFRDPRMAAAMKNLGADEFAAVSKYLGWYNRLMSGLLTRYNPAFTAVNLLRDATLGVTGVAAEHGTKTAAQVAGAYVPALNAMWKHARDKSGTGRWDKHATEYAAAGGKTSFTLMDSVEDLNLRVGDEFKKFGQIIREGRTAMAVMKAVRDSRLIHLIENVNDAVENAMRLATYGTLREQGMSVEQAAERAKNLTVNFNRRGSHASILNAAYLFFNASVQGTHRTLRLMKHPGVLATLGGLSALQVAATLLAMSIEDDDGERLWDKVSEYDKMRNLVFVVPYKDDAGKLRGRVVKWPMPYGFNMFPYAAGRLAKLGVDMKDDRTETAGREAAGMVNDMGAAALNAFSPVDLERGWDAFVPNIIRDFTALKENRDDLGRPITAEQPFTKYDVPRAAMGKAETPAAFKGLARALNRVGGGDDYTPPHLPMFFDWSPEDLKYLTEKFTGGVGRELGRTEQLAEKLIGGLEPSLNDIPIIRSLVADVNMRQATAGRYYDTRENIERELDRMKDAYVSGGQSAAEAVMDDAGPVLEGVEFATYKRDGERDDGTEYEEGDIKLSETGRPEVTAESGTVYRTYKDTEAALEDMRQESRRIFNDTSLSFAERRKKLDELQVRREKVQREFNRRFNQERRTH